MRFLRRRSLPTLLALAATGVATLAVPPTLAALDVLPWSQALILGGLLLLGMAVCALGAGLWMLRRTVHALNTAMDTHIRRVVEEIEAGRLEAARAGRQTHKSLERLETVTLPRMRHRFERKIREQGHRDYAQQVAWTELRDHLGVPAAFMPKLRGWAASPDVLSVVVRHIDRLRPGLVVECGSGASTVWIGYALRRVGHGRLVAIEHEAVYAERTRDLVAEHGLDDIVEVRYAPLTKIEPDIVTVDGDRVTTADRWYDPSVLIDLVGIGVLFVDGPPEATGRQARYPAVPTLFPRCTEDAVIILDDTVRPDEKAMGERWLTENPELRRTEEPAEKGAHIFSRKGV